MQNYQNRVVTEHDELKDKLDKLRDFIDDANSPFHTLDGEEQWKQEGYMSNYLNILAERINAFR